MGELLQKSEKLNQDYSTGKVNGLLIDICKEVENISILVNQLVKEKKEEAEVLSSEPSVDYEDKKCSSVKTVRKKKK